MANEPNQLPAPPTPPTTPTAIAPTGTPMSPAAVAATKVNASSPAAATQLKDLPLNELNTIARDYGLEPRKYETKPALVSAILERRTLIASMDRDAMLEVAAWGRRSIPANASRERIAAELVRVKSMRFVGLSHRGLLVLAKLRGLRVNDDEQTSEVIAKLKDQEGFFAKIGRKRRNIVGKLVSKMIGEPDVATEAAAGPAASPARDESTREAPARGQTPPPRASASTSGRRLHEEIEEVGLIAGITGRMRRTADQYLNQKLDEIEARIDRKLDEIDRRLAEWRDKEVANRLRILKISLWATVAVGTATLIISYIRVYMPWLFGG